jgi:hypothetical protein
MHIMFALVLLFMNSSRRQRKRTLYTTSLIASSLTSFALAAIIIMAPNMAYAQLGGLFPFFPTSEVLPTYIVRIIPGAAFENSLFHYYPEDIAIPAGTTISWFNDDPAQPHTVTSGIPDDPSNIFNSGVMPYGSFFQYTFDEAGTFDYHCMIHPWRTGSVTVSDTAERGHNFELRSGTGPILD